MAGGGPQLREQLGERIDVPMQDFDPFAGAVGLDVPAGSRGAFAGAAGLLFARAESRGLPINFVQPREPKPVRDPKNRRFALVGVAMVAAIVIVVACCWQVVSRRPKGADGPPAAKHETWTNPWRTRARKTSRIGALANWDNVVWLDELYDLTDRIPDVNALRITQISTEPMTRTAKEKYVARIKLAGNIYGDQGRKALDDLMNGFKKDGYYSAEAPTFNGNEFPVAIKVERRPPGEYKRTLPAAPDGGQQNGFDPAAMFRGFGQ